MKDLVDRIKEHLSKNDMTQIEFANKLGVTPETVNRWLNRRYEIPTPAVKLIKYIVVSTS